MIRQTDTRLLLFLAATFAITWSCWWALAFLVPPGGTVFAQPSLATLYIVGGFGPTIGALFAVATTPHAGSFREYLSRLCRWRVNPAWYLAAFALPPVLAFMLGSIASSFGPHGLWLPALPTLSRVAVLFATMIVGGGLEELGWRGVAQPSLEKMSGGVAACFFVGCLWAIWHLPLFHIPGVSQFGGNFPLFALNVLANAFLLGWLYGETKSILLCILFHAASNTSSAVGLDIPAVVPLGMWAAACIKLLIGFALVAMAERR